MGSFPAENDECIICTNPISISFEYKSEDSSNSHLTPLTDENDPDDYKNILLKLLQGSFIHSIHSIPPSELQKESYKTETKSSQYCSLCLTRNKQIIQILERIQALTTCLEQLKDSVESDLHHSFVEKQQSIPLNHQDVPPDPRNATRFEYLKSLNLIQEQEAVEEPEDDHVRDPNWFPETEDFEDSSENTRRSEASPKVLVPSTEKPDKNLKEIDAIVIVQKLPKDIVPNVPINLKTLESLGVKIPPTKKPRKHRRPRFVCKVPDCPRKLCFKTKEEFRLHMLTHEGITHPYPCPHCSLKFKKNHLRSVHIRNVHEGRKTYFCEHCGKGCVSKSDLSRHSVIHSSELTIQCPLCPQKFKTNHVLRSHQKWKHSEKRDYNCDRCGKCFVTPQKLKTHIKAIHEAEDKPFVCHLCGKGFPVQGYLYMHMRNSHKLTMDGKPYHFNSQSAKKENPRKEKRPKRQRKTSEKNCSEINQINQIPPEPEIISPAFNNINNNDPDIFLSHLGISPGTQEFIIEDHPDPGTVIVVTTSSLPN